MSSKKKVPHKDQPSQGNISIDDTVIIANNIEKVNPKVSIIIPAYNVEKYIIRCLESVAAQTCQNLEIIIVNDGSTDSTKQLCAGFVKNEPRAKLINQKNQGLSIARNHGIEQATGDYLALIDGDDEIAPDFVEKLATAVIKSNSDIAVCGYRIISEQSQTSVSPPIAQVSGSNATVNLLTQQKNYDVIACNKLYKRELFKYIKYPARQIHEDNLTTYKLYAAAKKVCFLEEPLYFYHKRSGSITTTTKKTQSLFVKQQAAREAIQYFQDFSKLDPVTQNAVKNSQTLLKLQQAAKVSFLLSQFAFLDHALRQEIPAEFIDLAITNIKKHSDFKNPYLSKRLRVYLYFIKTPKAFIYKIYRTLKSGNNKGRK